jgi:hypothetical protein
MQLKSCTDYGIPAASYAVRPASSMTFILTPASLHGATAHLALVVADDPLLDRTWIDADLGYAGVLSWLH